MHGFPSDPDIVNGVYWSEALNKVFVDNFERDPTLTWQYFGSAKGFFRQYPGEERKCVFVCVCEREREREIKGRLISGSHQLSAQEREKKIRTNDLESLKG